MSDVVIRAEGISKRYKIGRRERYRALRDRLTDLIHAPARLARAALAGEPRPTPPADTGQIWALSDVSFEVRRGEVVGIIGRNGAGKSTLLKILSRITRPTSGRVAVRGRVGSLLEVGTGFHPELTGRENIALNGAILGMRRDEVRRKFDEIVAFAEVEQFIDTPVKHYSSGMYMRLAFAVAAHLEPEVLVVDEVLAVGDAEFQKKCLGKMGEVARDGRTVLFVSHNLGAVTHLCQRGVVLERGAVALIDSAQNAVDFYHRQTIAAGQTEGGDTAPHVLFELPASQLDPIAITRIELLGPDSEPWPTPGTWDTFSFRIWYRSNRQVSRGSAVIEISSRDGARLMLLSTQPDSIVELPINPGEQYVDCTIEGFPLSSGEYILGAGLAIPNVEWLWHQPVLANLVVHAQDVYASGKAPIASRYLVAPRHHWRVSP